MERIGVVLTAGSQIKNSPVFDNPDERFVDEDGEFIFKRRSRIEPDLEDKIRPASARSLETYKYNKIARAELSE